MSRRSTFIRPLLTSRFLGRNVDVINHGQGVGTRRGRGAARGGRRGREAMIYGRSSPGTPAAAAAAGRGREQRRNPSAQLTRGPKWKVFDVATRKQNKNKSKNLQNDKRKTNTLTINKIRSVYQSIHLGTGNFHLQERINSEHKLNATQNRKPIIYFIDFLHTHQHNFPRSALSRLTR